MIWTKLVMFLTNIQLGSMRSHVIILSHLMIMISAIIFSLKPVLRISQYSSRLQPQGSAVNDRGDQIADPMEEDFLTRLSRSLDHWKPQGPAVSERRSDIRPNGRRSSYAPLFVSWLFIIYLFR
ncbi:uncharacterized protein LOC126592490 [Malus sylvestris]|uniref:uncharacterized protein LOC126592490 n=1 Tax=Malus sylvestris TaxID=3752 RepID=UPI0021AD006E|nr:uncharacterized protein LOC126592490 [Malus sylvestris]